jgi:hypothetical protein
MIYLQQNRTQKDQKGDKKKKPKVRQEENKMGIVMVAPTNAIIDQMERASKQLRCWTESNKEGHKEDGTTQLSLIIMKFIW